MIACQPKPTRTQEQEEQKFRTVVDVLLNMGLAHEDVYILALFIDKDRLWAATTDMVKRVMDSRPIQRSIDDINEIKINIDIETHSHYSNNHNNSCHFALGIRVHHHDFDDYMHNFLAMHAYSHYFNQIKITPPPTDFCIMYPSVKVNHQPSLNHNVISYNCYPNKKVHIRKVLSDVWYQKPNFNETKKNYQKNSYIPKVQKKNYNKQHKSGMMRHNWYMNRRSKHKQH